MYNQPKTFKVTYTKKIGGNNTILVKAANSTEAISNAKHLCFTGKDFREAIETNDVYSKPRTQGFAGRN